MRKNKWIFCVLLVGLLLCGIGGGILFVEFSGLSYAGEYVYETDEPETLTREVSLEECPEGPVYVSCSLYMLHPLADRVVVDPAMEEGLLRIETTYDPMLVRPSIYLDTVSRVDPQKPEAQLWLDFYSASDGLEIFFQFKDMILKDLKNSILRSYRTVDVMDLTITAGPRTAERIVCR